MGTSAASMSPVLGLVWTLVRTDFKARYHGTAGGFLWALLKPFAMLAVLLAVFSLAFADSPGYTLDLVVGLFLWDFFAEATRTGLLSLASKSYLLTKARFRSWIVVVASMANALITLGVCSVVIAIVLLTAGRAPSVTALGLYLWYVLHAVAMVAGFSLAASVLFLRYRDLHQIWDVVIQAGFFVAPVVYPIGIIPERYHVYVYLWPPTPIIQFARSVLVEGRVPTARAHLLLSLAAVVLLACGWLVFRRGAPRAAEYV